MARPKVWIDTEYSNSYKKDMDVICVSMQVDTRKPVTWWTHNDPCRVDDLFMEITDLVAQGAIFFAYLASAECRALESLGIDSTVLNWVDVYTEWRQLHMNNNRRTYGRYLRKASVAPGEGGLVYGKHGYSEPPSMVARDNEGKDNVKVASSYASVAYHLLGEIVDGKRKDAMRDICIRGDRAEIEAHRKEISEYCESDIEHLPKMWEVISTEIMDNFHLSKKDYHRIALDRGKFAGPVTARIERRGIPFNVQAANHLSQNVQDARHTLLSRYIESVEFPFYALEKPTLKVFKGKYVSKYALFENYVTERLNVDDWNRTESGRLSQDNDDLKEYDGDPNIGEYRQVKKALQGLQSFDPDSKSAKQSGLIMESVDPADSRLRVLFGIFGTMTGRNAPKARRFPFAMGRWARSLLQPQAGWTIGSIDYASQEFAVAAHLSNDPNMIKAYESGDPYLYFAKAAGAVPWEATAKEYPRERNLFKATTLGLQYGMGKVKLARKLTIDTGEEVSVKDATKLINLHRKIYKVYWKWAKSVINTYRRDNCIVLADGWGLNAHCDRETSVRNFPVQGTGAVILRRALVLAEERRIPVVSPLHDAIYICCPDEEFDHQIGELSKVMHQAVHEVLGKDVNIRQDIEKHSSTDVWIERGAESVYGALAPFMEKRESETRKRKNFLKDLLTNPKS